MVNNNEIKKSFAGLVGFSRANDPSYPKIKNSLLRSDSGLYVKHALTTIENIYNTSPQFDSFSYPAWQDRPYESGSIVTYQSVKYKALINIYQGLGAPSGSTESWEVFDGFNDYLQEIYDRACTNLVNNLIKYKQLRNAGKSLIDSMQLYQGAGMLQDRIVKHSRFVGTQFRLNGQESIQVKLTRVGLQVDKVQANLNFYLYHSSQHEPLQVFSVNVNKSESFAWFQLEDAVMSYVSQSQNAGGTFFFGYYEDDLTGQAISRQMDLMRPCVTCSTENIRLFNNWSKHVKAHSFSVPSSALSLERNLFDTSKVTYSTSSNFGLNFSISVMCDLTEFFVTNKMLFAEALSMQLGLDILEKIAFNTRLNAISIETKKLAMAELDETSGSGSFASAYIKSLKALSFEFSGFTSTCLPCTNNRGITYGSV